jgi:hypothetical protein
MRTKREHAVCEVKPLHLGDHVGAGPIAQRGLATYAAARAEARISSSFLMASFVQWPFEGGICGPLRRWSGPRTTRIGGRALSILQLWVTWCTSNHGPALSPCLIDNPNAPRLVAELIDVAPPKRRDPAEPDRRVSPYSVTRTGSDVHRGVRGVRVPSSINNLITRALSLGSSRNEATAAMLT